MRDNSEIKSDIYTMEMKTEMVKTEIISTTCTHAISGGIS
jgi:hypothetical protein